MNAPIPNQLYPAILSDSLHTVSEQVALAKQFEHVTTVQIDVIDGFYTDNITVFPEDVLEIDFEPLEIDFHFMVNEPLDFVLQVAAFGQNLPIRAMIAQIERMSSQAGYLSEVKRLGWKTGLSLDLYTPLDEVDDESWANLDVLQLMGIEAGEQGQTFVPLVLEKITAARKLITDKKLEIELIVDGGIKLENVAQIKKAGANSLTVGSLLWTAAEPQQMAQKLHQNLS